ncbi:MAG: ABC transporter substrate-binding protein [Actinomycetota bacterium]
MTPGHWAKLGASAALMMALLAGCDPAGLEDPISPRASDPSPAVVRGGSATFGVYGEPATLDPHSPLASDLTYALARPLYRSLYRFTPEGEPVPDLVRSIQESGEVATIELANARWSNGSPITSRDVAASIRRAQAPSGLAEIESVSRRGPRRLVVTGPVVDWTSVLARISYVTPAAGGRRLYSGPFLLRSRAPGLQLVLEPNPASDTQPFLDRVTIRFTEGLDFLIGLVADGRLDAAWLPSSVNLGQRLAEHGLIYYSALGWERVYLDLSGADLSAVQTREIARALDRAQIERGFIRGDGRVANTLHPGPAENGSEGPYERIFRGPSRRVSVDLQLSAPIGDELLELVQRSIQVQLDTAGSDIELVNVDARRFYGEWAAGDPIAAALRRAGGTPGRQTEVALDHLPLFHVRSTLASGDELQGLEVNPTLDGPLWNAERWHLAQP